MTELTERLAALTEQFMTTDCKQSHKRTRLFLEMQETIREIKKLNNSEHGLLLERN